VLTSARIDQSSSRTQWTPSALYDNQRKEHEAYAGSAAAYRTRTSSSAVNYTSNSSCIQINKTELICSWLRIDYGDSHQHINRSGSRQTEDQTSPHQHLLQPHSSSCLQQLATAAACFHYSSLSAHSSNQLLQLCTSTFSSVHQHQNSSNQLRCVQFGGHNIISYELK
jgi:hypothetical protein